MSWLVFAMTTAIFESLKDIVSKKLLLNVDEYVVAWAWLFFPVPFITIALLIQGFPPIGTSFWGIVVFGGFVLLSSFVLYSRAIKMSDLSITVPMIALTPIFLLLTSPLMIGEFPGFWGIVGIILIVMGSYILNIREKCKGWLAPFKALLQNQGSRMMLGVAFIWSIGANLDKMGIQHASPFFWLAAANLYTAILMLPLLVWRKGSLQSIVKHAKGLTLIGLFSAIATMTQMIAITMTLVPYVISVKRTSVMMSVIAGHFIFHETSIRERLIGVAVMLLGIVVITLST